ncbi:lamin tail domain-containing protein [Chitinispirillales bacterium ANBcel5]|uniref:lamin tail domain-containing protein n=1 Tax=Cellulosispirillum alkaliphilum TaxID=3039283 RepID=UPI002A5066C3|nr:lamin tail domain-containing protein [Chitinispirillales bacterium ANBcel5]
MPCRKTSLAFLSVIFFVLIHLSCGQNPVDPPQDASGSLEVRALINNNTSKLAKTVATTFNTINVVVTGNDFDTLRCTIYADPFRPSITDTVRGIPPGTNRTVQVWTSNAEGETIHIDSEPLHTIRIDRGITTRLDVNLIPVKGSIFLQLTDIPGDVDTIVAVFASDERIWEVRQGASGKFYLSLDNIPHETEGFFSVIALGAGSTGDTLFISEQELFFDARSAQQIQLEFSTVTGSIELVFEIEQPGSVLSSGTFSPMAPESGELIITEIMYAVTDSEYVELFNPSPDTPFNGDLIIQIDKGTERVYEDITIAPQSYFVIGAREMPWADIWHETASALRLVRTGNWITLKKTDGTVMDRVVFSPQTAGLQWPPVSDKKSIELKREYYDVSSNNHGRYWKVSTTPIEGTGMYGTPGY